MNGKHVSYFRTSLKILILGANERQPFTGFFSITCKASDVRLIKEAWRSSIAEKIKRNFFFFKFHYRRKTFADDAKYMMIRYCYHFDRISEKSFRFDSSSHFKNHRPQKQYTFYILSIINGIILESLQWIGETGLREAAEGRVVTAKLVCRDASQKSKLPGVFTPCVAFRVAGSQSKSSRYSSSLLNRFNPPLE